MSTAPSPNQAKGRLASIYRYRPEDQAGIARARRDLAAAKIDAFVEKALADVPPLTNEQCDRIAALLRGVS